MNYVALSSVSTVTSWFYSHWNLQEHCHWLQWKHDFRQWNTCWRLFQLISWKKIKFSGSPQDLFHISSWKWVIRGLYLLSVVVLCTAQRLENFTLYWTTKTSSSYAGIFLVPEDLNIDSTFHDRVILCNMYLYLPTRCSER